MITCHYPDDNTLNHHKLSVSIKLTKSVENDGFLHFFIEMRMLFNVKRF